MSACEVLSAEASAGVAPALRAVDCLVGETVVSAFARLDGLLPALTIALTLYIAFFAIGLLTGRSRLGIAALTPRMIALGFVLTFATSWVAYSQVVWNLAVGAPDEIASILTGTSNSSGGSATQIFGDRVDLVFGAIADAAEAGKQAAPPAQAGQQGAQAASAAVSGNFTPANVMWLGALLLLLGTVGVLLTARIAMAVLLAVGPIFIVLSLFSGTRGLFVGWLRGLTLTAVTPLFVVVGGGVVMELLVPVVASLQGVGGVSGRAALALFVIASVHVALMAMMLKVAGTMVSAWQVFGLARREGDRDGPSAAPTIVAPAAAPLLPSPAAMAAGGRTAGLVSPASIEVVAAGSGSSGSSSTSRTLVSQVSNGRSAELPPLPRSRARGIGSRFAAPQMQGRAGGLIR
ncbi:type IV secretion system protein [Novosphingobium sp. G106]|uniref:type IV secretion system protein n=1 Tax=Novosphingobium sp. G106 TaxID=2849500 RepID=UPI001C2D8CB1|nr:type IV secretion system protein [Novosphingobium sp. G106]MBV1690156.1 type IV secretion system protein [Novosphingobium sp. G106]